MKLPILGRRVPAWSGELMETCGLAIAGQYQLLDKDRWVLLAATHPLRGSRKRTKPAMDGEAIHLSSGCASAAQQL